MHVSPKIASFSVWIAGATSVLAAVAAPVCAGQRAALAIGNAAYAHAPALATPLNDGSRTFALVGGATLSPSVELGVRQDGGDAETRTGLEYGAGFGYAHPSRGLDMALRVHGLAVHAEDGLRPPCRCTPSRCGGTRWASHRGRNDMPCRR